jgi:copper chaperone CopZ
MCHMRRRIHVSYEEEDTCAYALQVDGMGCEACQTHVKNVLDRSGGVIASSVDFTTGHAEVCNKNHAQLCSKSKVSKVV